MVCILTQLNDGHYKHRLTLSLWPVPEPRSQRMDGRNFAQHYRPLIRSPRPRTMLFFFFIIIIIFILFILPMPSTPNSEYPTNTKQWLNKSILAPITKKKKNGGWYGGEHQHAKPRAKINNYRTLLCKWCMEWYSFLGEHKLLNVMPAIRPRFKLCVAVIIRRWMHKLNEKCSFIRPRN